MLSAVRYVAGDNFVCQQPAAQRTSMLSMQRFSYCSMDLNFLLPELCPDSLELNFIHYNI